MMLFAGELDGGTSNGSNETQGEAGVQDGRPISAKLQLCATTASQASAAALGSTLEVTKTPIAVTARMSAR